MISIWNRSLSEESSVESQLCYRVRLEHDGKGVGHLYEQLAAQQYPARITVPIVLIYWCDDNEQSTHHCLLEPFHLDRALFRRLPKVPYPITVMSSIRVHKGDQRRNSHCSTSIDTGPPIGILRQSGVRLSVFPVASPVTV